MEPKTFKPKTLILDVIGSGEEMEVTTAIRVGRHYFERVGQGEEPLRPYHDGYEGVVAHLEEMEEICLALGISLTQTAEFNQEFKTLKEEHEQEAKQGEDADSERKEAP